MKNPITLLLFMAVLGIFSACRTTEEGCLDPNATNFKPSADKDCKCCNYTKAQFNTWHRVLDTSEVFELEAQFLDPQNVALQALDIKLLVSNVQILDLSNNWLPIQDTLDAKYLNGDFAFLSNSFGIISPNKFSVDMGKFLAQENYQGFKFTIGLAGQATQIDRSTVRPTTHILGTSPTESTFDSTSMQMQSYIMRIVKGVDTFKIQSTIAQEIILLGDIETRAGANTFLNMYILWGKLFENIDWEQDSAEEIQRKIDENLPYIFQFGQ